MYNVATGQRNPVSYGGLDETGVGVYGYPRQGQPNNQQSQPMMPPSSPNGLQGLMSSLNAMRRSSQGSQMGAMRSGLGFQESGGEPTAGSLPDDFGNYTTGDTGASLGNTPEGMMGTLGGSNGFLGTAGGGGSQEQQKQREFQQAKLARNPGLLPPQGPQMPGRDFDPQQLQQSNPYQQPQSQPQQFSPYQQQQFNPYQQQYSPYQQSNPYQGLGAPSSSNPYSGGFGGSQQGGGFGGNQQGGGFGQPSMSQPSPFGGGFGQPSGLASEFGRFGQTSMSQSAPANNTFNAAGSDNYGPVPTPDPNSAEGRSTGFVPLVALPAPAADTTVTGSAGSADASASIDPSQSSLSANFAPYVYSMLQKGEAAANMPYQDYTGQRFAGASPLQTQAFQGIGSLQTPGQYGTATNAYQNILNQTSGGVGLNAADPNTVNAFMSPYQQGVTDIAKREASRQAGIAGNAMAGQAVRSGAFGGSRQAIQKAEANRNLGQQLNDIQTTGSNTAYTQAMNSLNNQRNAALYGQTNAAQGLGSIGTAQGNMTNAQYNQMLNAGSTQQGINQQPLDFGYQQWQDSLNYPQVQAKNMQSLLSGLPVQAPQYNSGQSTLSALLSGGLSGLALSKLLGGG